MIQSSDKRKHTNDSEEQENERRKGRKKGFVWSHVINHEDGRVSCMHCGDIIKITFGEKVERLRKHFVKVCSKSPFQKDSKEYEELCELDSVLPTERKKKLLTGNGKKSNKLICGHIDAINSILSGSSGPYQALSLENIALLESQGNRSSNWNDVKIICQPGQISFDSSLIKIRNCTFNGHIYLGLFLKNTILHGGISVASGLYNSNFSGTCVLSDNCYIWNTAMLMNVYVGRSSCIVSCGNVIADGYTSYGTQRVITVGAESVNNRIPRHIILNLKQSYLDCVSSAFLRPIARNILDVGDDNIPVLSGSNNTVYPTATSSNSNNTITNRTKRTKYNKHDGLIHFGMTIICDDVELNRCGLIRNVFVGSYTFLRDSLANSSSFVKHCEITDSQVIDSVIHPSCKISGGVEFNGVLMFSHSSASSSAKVTDSVLGPDSSISIGECKHSLLGPHVGFHHQSLLIASTWAMGRGNIAYGAMIGANHTSRLNDQECFPGEGLFFGLGCSVKFPFNALESPFSIVASNAVCVPQKIAFPFSLICSSSHAFHTDNNEVNSAASILKPGWVLSSNPYFLERSINKYTRRRRSADYRTDLPIFRPTIADMVADARNRLLKYKEFQIQSSSTPSVTSLLLVERQISGAGKSVIQSSDIDPAVDAYTQFIHRYALHGLLYMVTFAGELPVTSFSNSIDNNEATNQHVLDMILSDVESMQCGLPSIADHLHQLSVGTTAPPASSTGAKAMSIASLAEPLASEIPSPGAQLLLHAAAIPCCCILTDTHNPMVRNHQLKVLRDEFPDVDVLSYLRSASLRGKDRNIPNDTKVKQLLRYLSELENAYCERVKSCKLKDSVKAAQIIPDYLFNSSEGDDETILSANIRAMEIARVVQYLL